MADGISFRMLTGPFEKGIASRQKRMPRAAMFAVREAGRVAKRAGRAAAPVLKDASALSHAKLQRYSRAGFDVKAAYGTGVAGDQGRPVPGLLKASISSSKRIRQSGVEFTIKVGPRGQRTHLYAGKIEEQAHYMDAAERAAVEAMPVIAERAFNRVWKER